MQRYKTGKSQITATWTATSVYDLMVTAGATVVKDLNWITLNTEWDIRYSTQWDLTTSKWMKLNSWETMTLPWVSLDQLQLIAVSWTVLVNIEVGRWHYL